MNILTRLNNVLVRFSEWMMVALLGIMCTGVALQMILRFFFTTSILQIEDIVKFSFSWLIFMGVAALFKNDEHIAVTALVDALPKKAGHFMYLVQRVLTFVFLIGMLTIGIRFAVTGLNSIGSQLMIPLFWIYISIPLAAAFAVSFYLEFFIGEFRRKA